jgi:hypothetical protein
MKKLIAKPHLFFFGLVPLFIILGFFKSDGEISINIDYMQLDLKVNTICYLSAIFFSLIGLNYFSILLMGKKLKKGLTITHIAIQLVSFIPFFYILFTATKIEETVANSQQYLDLFSIPFLIGFFLFLSAIFIHLINFSVSLFLKKQ